MIKFIVNCLVSIITVCILFLLAEGVTRLVMPDSVKLRLMHQPDEKLGYALVPTYTMTHQTSEYSVSININSEGLRDHDYSAKKDPLIYRILVLGDSFTFGVGVNAGESYPKMLEAMLNKTSRGNAAKRYEVINAGVEGYGTEQEYLYLQKLQSRYKPDLVIVGLHSNDIDDVMRGIPSAIMKQKIKRHFYFLSYLRGVHLLVTEAFTKKFILENILAIYQDHYSPEFERALHRTEELLVDIRDFARSQGAKTLVVIIPSCLEIDRAEWDKKGFGRLYNDAFFTGNMGRFSDTFTEFGKPRQLPTLPLLPALRNSSVRPIYFTRDPHWTREGHRVAAESIFMYLTEKHLLRD